MLRGVLRDRFERGILDGVLRDRFERGILDGELPSSTDAATLAQFLQIVNVGLSVQGATGVTRKELMTVVSQTLSTCPGQSRPK